MSSQLCFIRVLGMQWCRYSSNNLVSLFQTPNLSIKLLLLIEPESFDIRMNEVFI